MDAADKFEVFIKICKWLFIILLILKILGIINISWWIIFIPIIVPIVIILKELGLFKF